MKTVDEVKSKRELLRSEIEKASNEIDRLILREEIFVLDGVLGLFSDGQMKRAAEIFKLLQEAQLVNHKLPVQTEAECKAYAAVEMYKWVMSAS